MSRNNDGQRKVWMCIALACAAMLSIPSVYAANAAVVGAVPTVTPGGKGSDVLPIVTQQIISYPTATSVRVRFDPSTTYVPTAPAGQTYLFQAAWTFEDVDGADDSTFLVPAGAPVADPAQALRQIEATFNFIGDTLVPAKPSSLFNVTFRLNITLASGGPGPSGFVQTSVTVSPANDFPEANIVQLNSPATGLLPYTVSVSISASKDKDGFVTWAGIDWGDGTADRITQALPADPAIPIFHTYTQPGVYRVTLSVIDNGRQALPIADPAGLPGPGDVIGVMLAYTAAQGADTSTHSRLDQDMLFVQVPGSMTTIKSDFQLDFVRTNNDRFKAEFQPNIILESIGSTDVTLTVGGLSYPTFKTDGRGKFRGQGITFDFNVRKKRLKVTISKRALAAAFGQTNTSIVNGNVDIPVNIVVAGTTSPLATTIRYAYNSQKDKKGQGKEGVSFPNGN